MLEENIVIIGSDVTDSREAFNSKEKTNYEMNPVCPSLSVTKKLSKRRQESYRKVFPEQKLMKSSCHNPVSKDVKDRKRQI